MLNFLGKGVSMKENILEFMDNVKIKDKSFASYKNYDKGIAFTFNTVNLLPKLDYLEADDKQYDVLVASKKIEDLDYKEIDTTKAVLKSEITGKEEDKNTITEKEVKAKQIWNLSNALGVYKSYVDKDDAIEEFENLTKRVMEFIE